MLTEQSRLRRSSNKKTDGTFEEGTINYMVDKRLKEMAEKMGEFPGFTTRFRRKQ